MPHIAAMVFRSFTSNNSGHNRFIDGDGTSRSPFLPPITADMMHIFRSVPSVFGQVIFVYRRISAIKTPPITRDNHRFRGFCILQYRDTYPPIFYDIPPIQADTTSNNKGQYNIRKLPFFPLFSAIFAYEQFSVSICMSLYVLVGCFLPPLDRLRFFLYSYGMLLRNFAFDF